MEVAMSAKPRYYYTVQTEITVHHSKYGHVTVEFFTASNTFNQDRVGVRLTWQADSDKNYWYAMKFVIEVSSKKQWTQAQRIVTTIRRKWPTWDMLYSPSPQDVLAQLERSSYFAEAAYDNRQHDVVPLGAETAPNLSRWVDDCRTYDNGTNWQSCLVDCFTETKEEAQAAITVALAAKDKHNGALVKFIQAGKPVWRTDEAPGAPPTPGAKKLGEIENELWYGAPF